MVAEKTTNSFLEKIGVPGAKYLVYTSAGDNSNLGYWLADNKRFDLWITYYGEKTGRYYEVADFYNQRKGGKFPNFYFVYHQWRRVISQYDAILLIDDDILINAVQIYRLFALREEYDLWVLQPAFDPQGKIRHRITHVQPQNLLRYTNFVEVTCPLFRQDKLDNFMAVYDPVLVGWGVDYWFMNSLGHPLDGKVAIVDDVPCINPCDHTKGGKREIEMLQSTESRKQTWEAIKLEKGIFVEKMKEFGSVSK